MLYYYLQTPGLYGVINIIIITTAVITINTWIHVSMCTSENADNQKHQQQKCDDTHENDEPSGRRMVRDQQLWKNNQSA